MRKARIGIIGVGWWGTAGHLEPLADDPTTEVVAVWSRTESKARRRAEAYGVPRYYTDCHAMIDECDIDGVIVASTPNVHYEQARLALEHGLHVLVEKPFVLKAAHANTLQRLAKEKGLLLSVCHPMLFHAPLQEARRAIQEGALGHIMCVTAHFAQRVYELYRGQVPAYIHVARRGGDPLRPNQSSYSDPAVAGGGEGHTQASHILGALLWLTGLQPESVFAYMHNAGAAVDVVDALTIRFAGGTVGTVAANGLLPAGIWEAQIHMQGDGGIMHCSTGRSPGTTRAPAGADMHEYSLPTANDYADACPEVPRNFVRAILGQEPLHVETEVAVNEARILAAAYASASSGRPVAIER